MSEVITSNVPPTPAQHVSSSKETPIQLLALGAGPDGKTALLEFPGGWQRTVLLAKESDAWHPMFANLPQADQSRLRKHVEPPVTVQPDGSRKREHGMSFIRENLGPRGGHLSYSFFDVPLQKYADGTVTGYRCAIELLDRLQQGYGPHVALDWVLPEAAIASEEKFDGSSRRGAGSAFMDVVTEALRFFAKNARYEDWLEKKVAQAEKTAAWCDHRDAEKKTAFVERMKQARRSKSSSASTVEENFLKQAA